MSEHRGHDDGRIDEDSFKEETADQLEDLMHCSVMKLLL